MPIYVLKCDRCGEEFERLFLKDIGPVMGQCPCCPDGILRKRPAAPSFTVHGYSARNGYSTR